MKMVFFDTWGWASIAHRNDTHHDKVAPFYSSFLLNKGIPVTTDYVLAETITLLRSKTNPEAVTFFIDTILNAVEKDKIALEQVDMKRWEKAWQLSKKYSDKPNISFFDFTSFVVMKECNIKNVLTANKHFEEVGLGFKKLF